MTDQRDTERHKQDVKLSLFGRNMCRAMGTMFGYGTGIALVLMVYRWFGIIPFDWLFK